MSLADAAGYLGVDTRTVCRLRERGELRAVRLPLGGRTVRRVLFDRADLDRLVERAKAA